MTKLTPQDVTLFIYNLALLPVICFSVFFLLLSITNLFIGNKKNKYQRLKKLPFITIQIPTYNDPVAERCVKQCLKFDYPRDSFEIIIADDSTNAETQRLLRHYSDKFPGFVKYLHRNNRHCFKPGALENALNFTRGEIIVIFDSDWIPKKNFLRRIIIPFSDPMIAIVQSGQAFYNKDTNLITRFASHLMMIYHNIIMPINNKINCVFFCGTAGAIRKSALLEAGGWNVNSITEDCDLTVNLLLRGYKTAYMDFTTPSEVPDTFEGFIKQQMRWCYGNTRVFFDYAKGILFKRGISLKQRFMIMYVTLGNIIAPIVVIMTISGFLGWFLGELRIFQFNDIIKFVTVFVYTSGFIIMGAIVLYRNKQIHDLPYLFLSALTIGIVLSVANSFAFCRAIINKKLNWFCTPKAANDGFLKN